MCTTSARAGFVSFSDTASGAPRKKWDPMRVADHTGRERSADTRSALLSCPPGRSRRPNLVHRLAGMSRQDASRDHPIDNLLGEGRSLMTCARKSEPR
jgi:hypothetical protein